MLTEKSFKDAIALLQEQLDEDGKSIKMFPQLEILPPPEKEGHGVIQDLGKYYKEYQEAETQERKETIEAVIRVRFAEFDSGNIKSTELRRFFINMRGY